MFFLKCSIFTLLMNYLILLMLLRSGVNARRHEIGKCKSFSLSNYAVGNNKHALYHNGVVTKDGWLQKYRNNELIALALPPPLERVKRDFLALTRRVTARHILIPKKTPMNVILTLKQNIRNRVYTGQELRIGEGESSEEVSVDDKMYIEDAFSSAAKKISQDDETAGRGGLLGTLVQQGYCRSPELDRACFEVPLGQIAGPIESDYGYHLLLVTERTNCPKLDGGYTRIIRGGENGKLAVLAAPGAGDKTVQEETTELALNQVAFWILTSLAGGLLAEVAAKAAGVIETLPFEDQIPFE